MKKAKNILALSLAAVMTTTTATVSFAAENDSESETAENPVVSVVNFSPKWGDKAANVEAMGKIIDEAGNSGTDIIIFPEMSVTGYSEGMEYSDGSSTAMPVELAESKSGQTAAYFSDLAQKYDMYIVYGATETVEGDDTHAYSSAFVCTPDGYVDSYQEMLTSSEDEWCVAGSTPVYFETEFGKVGLAVGSDAADLIELSRIYSADGCFMIADCNSLKAEDYTESYDFDDAVYCDYTTSYYNFNWTDYNRNSAYNVAFQAGLYLASANLAGSYSGGEFAGGSMITGMNSSEEYGKIWSMWKSLLGTGSDLVDYIVKVYAGGEDSTDEICTAALDLDTVTHEFVDSKLYQPDLYKEWYSELAEEGTSLTSEPTTSESPKVAVVEMNAAWGDKDANTEKMLSYIEQAYNEGVNIITFPEMALADYASTSDPDSEIWKTVVENAESTDGYYAQLIAEAAEEYNMYVIYGTAEVNPSDEQHPYNSAFVATPDGETLSYRKVQVVEGDWATWGTEPLIVDTPWGGMGISICKDTYSYPELARYYAAAGCTILINPTASSGYAGSNFIYNTAISSIVSRDGMALLSCDLVGTSGYEDSTLWPGKSTIIQPNGVSAVYLTEETTSGEKMLTATLDLSNAGFALESYNASVMAAAFEALDAGEAVYDGSGLVKAADYAVETEPTSASEESTGSTSSAEASTTAPASTVESQTTAATNDNSSSGSASTNSSNSSGSVKTGQEAAAVLLLSLICAGALAAGAFAVRKRTDIK